MFFKKINCSLLVPSRIPEVNLEELYMDISTVIGLVICIGAVLGTILVLQGLVLLLMCLV